MKRIKTIALTLTLAFVTIIGATGVYLNVHAAVRYDGADQLFYETLNEIFDNEKADTVTVSAEKERLYDIERNELGVAYDFTYGDKNGFAIVIDDGELQVTEFYPEGASPYRQAKGQSVYVKQGMYWYSDSERFYDCETALPVSEQSVAQIKDDAYQGSVDAYYETERVDFLYRSENKYNILSSIPACEYGEESGCVPKMGVNLIVYLDKTYPNLIPNYEPGTEFLGMYMYKSDTAQTMSVFDQLYIDMETGTDGATVSQFKSGMQKYVKRQGYNVSYGSLMSWGSFKYDSAKTAVQAGKPIALFIKNYRGAKIVNQDGYDSIEYEITNNNHSIAGFGCLEVNYTLAGNKTRTDQYVNGAFGFGLYGKGYVNIAKVTIADALTVTIS